ncbi:MAG: CidA/LrgA family protein [Lachnospiraceae bacterium]|uniref:CidA/LrgA family protein n=1 Tax=Roseburia hominis TaxID=301301 RepID=UPI001F3A3FCA|nr:CidA/LrgA family protein [Roseburia hominis]MDD6170039.1 CidA/LrgA family protein [Lachnospiraceae bacterium]MDY4840412.1 CidA/LrgA family protein [Lachnospiraceae bacterium]
MRFMKQFGVILAITFLGEILRYVIPLPIPASIYGLVLMLLALKSGVVKLDQVKETGDFLIEIMPMMFIPAAVGLLVSWDSLKEIWLPVVVITLLTTIIVMAVSGLVTQWIGRFGKTKSRKKD